MSNIWHLAQQTPKINPHQVFQISKILAWNYSTISNVRQYGHQCQNFFCLFHLLLLFSPNTYLSLSVCNTYLSLSPSGSLITLSIPFSPHHAVLTAPLTTTPRCQASYHHTPPSFRTVTTSCYPPRHRIFLNWLVVVGFAFRFVWFGWVLLFGLFDLGWVCAGGGYRCCCGNDCWWPLLQ